MRIIDPLESSETTPEEIQEMADELASIIEGAYPEMQNGSIANRLKVSDKLLESLGDEAGLSEYLANEEDYLILMITMGREACAPLINASEKLREKGLDDVKGSAARDKMNIIRSRFLAIFLEQKYGSEESLRMMNKKFRERVMMQMHMQGDVSPAFLLKLSREERAAMPDSSDNNSEEVSGLTEDLNAAILARVEVGAREKTSGADDRIVNRAVDDAKARMSNLPSNVDNNLPHILDGWESFPARVLHFDNLPA
ncbi:hypothetical protein HN709_00225 [Candidatus Peregrinibacteria bacterium]|jgi:hypothetical protein|nr:hypothetical protein [Candidatus Peregrinibacteria bacterium]MBT7736097.1 hypothetical protein [Candidatus Peregrinibacteria bacterium]